MQTFLDDTVGEATSPTLSSHAYRAIRAALMSGYFRPGERLTMRGLADEMQMSVTPVREAIQQLITERALFMPGARTVVVPRISRAEYDEIVLIRLALEGLAARFAIEVIGAADLVELRRINALHRESIESGNTVAALKNNRAFHFGIYRRCNMPSLIDLIENQWVRIGPTLNFLYPMYLQSLRGNQIHERMLDAIAARSAPDLEAALGEDMSAAKTVLHKVLEPST